MSTLYASFPNPEIAEKAVGALLDHGAVSHDLSLIAHETHAGGYRDRAVIQTADAEADAKVGLTTTTGADAAAGAIKGSVIGLGLGTLAAIAALAIPGVGLVLGGTALATALGAAAATGAAGAVAGGVTGFLKDQGVGEDAIPHFSSAFNEGGSILAVALPTGTLDSNEAESLLVKYGATHVASAHGDRTTLDRDVQQVPLVLDNPNINPVVVSPQVGVQHVVAQAPLTTMGSMPSTTAAIAAAVNAADVRPTVIDPVTGVMQEGVVVDPLTGVERPVQMVNGAVVYSQAIATQPVYVEDQLVASGLTTGDIEPTAIDPTTGIATSGYLVDPTTGTRRMVRVVDGNIIYAD